MTPYYEQDGITIYCGDCRDVMPLLGPVDAVVTDPPYGINWAMATWSDSPEDYAEMMRWLVQECARAVPKGWCYVFQAMPNCGHYHEWFPDGWRLFAACKNFVQLRRVVVNHSWVPVVFWCNGEPSGPNSAADTGHMNRDYHVGNVAGVFLERVEHPCRRPLDTMRHLTQLAAPIDGLILDPFSGIGTTLLAAQQTRRQAIGIELNQTYCDIAIRRLAQAVLPFASEPEPTQADLLTE